jgi:hypothetical protein
MKVFEKENELIIKETPAIIWFIGMFFTIIGGIFVYGSFGGFTNYNEVGIIVIYITRFMAFCAVAVGIWTIYKAPITYIRINNLTKNLNITKTSIFGKSDENINLENVRKFLLIEGRDDENLPIWTFGYEKNDGDLVELASMPLHSEDYQKNLVFQLNKYINREAIYSVYNI